MVFDLQALTLLLSMRTELTIRLQGFWPQQKKASQYRQVLSTEMPETPLHQS